MSRRNCVTIESQWHILSYKKKRNSTSSTTKMRQRGIILSILEGGQMLDDLTHILIYNKEKKKEIKTPWTLTMELWLPRGRR